MRAGPVGLLFHHDKFLLARMARDQGMITHANSKCAGGAVAVAGAVRQALEPGPVVVARFVARLKNLVQPVDSGVALALGELTDLVALSPPKALPKIIKLGSDNGDSLWADGEVISSSVVQAVLWSLYCFLRNPTDYIACVGEAIEAGGDTDTTAAMAGAICGAHIGYEKLPSKFAIRLHDKDEWSLDQLLDLADRIFHLISSKQISY